MKILEEEEGGHICMNCHAIIHNKYVHLSEKIYEDQNIVEEIYKYYSETKKNLLFLILKEKSLDILYIEIEIAVLMKILRNI